MAASTFFIPSVNVIGADSLTDAMNMMADYGFTRTLIVTDNMLTKLGMAGDVQKALEERNIFSVIYDGTQPNPTTENVAAGLKFKPAALFYLRMFRFHRPNLLQNIQTRAIIYCG